MTEGQGYRFEPEALLAFAESTSRLTAQVTEARTGLDAGRELPGAVYGEVGASSGFVAAFGDYTRRLLVDLDAVGRGIGGLAGAVRRYGEDRQRLDEDAASELRRAGGG